MDEVIKDRIEQLLSCIVKRRNELKFNQTQMGAYLGVNQSSVKAMEKGLTKITVERLFLVNDFLQFNFFNLLADQPEVEETNQEETTLISFDEKSFLTVMTELMNEVKNKDSSTSDKLEKLFLKLDDIEKRLDQKEM